MKREVLYLVAALALSGCEQEVPMVNLGIDEVYSVYRMRTLRLHPEFPGDGYVWTMPDRQGRDSVVGTQRDYFFVGAAPGDYYLTLRIR